MSDVNKRVDPRLDVELKGQPQNIRILFPVLDQILFGVGAILTGSGIGVYFADKGVIPAICLIGIGLLILGYVGINALLFRLSVAKNRSILFTPVREEIMKSKSIKVTDSQIASMWAHEEVEAKGYRMRFEHRQGSKFKIGLYPATKKV